MSGVEVKPVIAYETPPTLVQPRPQCSYDMLELDPAATHHGPGWRCAACGTWWPITAVNDDEGDLLAAQTGIRPEPGVETVRDGHLHDVGFLAGRVAEAERILGQPNLPDIRRTAWKRTLTRRKQELASAIEQAKEHTR